MAPSGKIDPTYHKGETVGEIVVQVLLAASNADKLALQRYIVIAIFGNYI